MKPYVCIVHYTKEDEDENSCFFRITHPATENSEYATIDVELSPVQQMLIARDLLKDFDLNRIDNG